MRPAQAQRTFDPHPFLATAGEGRKTMVFSKKQAIFVQGDRADTIFYLRIGKVKLTVLSQAGKEATLGILSDGSFLGEGSLAGQTLRMGSATAMTECLVLRIEKKAMMQSLHRERALADMFVKFLLGRIDQLFNSSEKRLARMLLLLAQFGKEGKTEAVLSRISQETLAEMVGTTRSRVSFFMNRFRKLGFVDYNSEGLQVHNSLIDVVLHD
jgi:CRP-like cAMP-binding protein